MNQFTDNVNAAFTGLPPQVWMVIGGACWAVAAAVFRSILTLLWRDIWGKETILAADVHEQNMQMTAKIEHVLRQLQRLSKRL